MNLLLMAGAMFSYRIQRVSKSHSELTSSNFISSMTTHDMEFYYFSQSFLEGSNITRETSLSGKWGESYSLSQYQRGRR